MPRLSRLSRPALVATVAAAGLACFVATTVAVRPVTLPGPGLWVDSPTRVHLRDGSVVAFRDGLRVTRDSAQGSAWRYDPLRRDSARVAGVALVDVVGAETFDAGIDHARTLAYNVAAVAGTVLFKITFGSCPTVYSEDGDSTRLESEAFSYSIAPMLEKRDVDRIAAQPGADGILRLEIRNEALETHYIDQAELLEVSHREGEEVFPAPYGHPVAVSGARPVAVAHDRAGRDVRAAVHAVDDSAFASDDAALAAAAATDDAAGQVDWIEVAVPREPGADSVALLLRMRSSLLTTILFYDHMLARPGARSLDWQARELGRIATLASLGRWFTGRMGLRVEVRDGGRYRQVARLVDFGPIAWRNVAVVVPAPERDSVRVRVSFLVDEWRIDRMAVAGAVRRVRPRLVPLAGASEPSGRSRDDVREVLRDADERRLATTPGQRLRVQFDAGRSPGPRTYLLAMQGYYTEWVRGEWLRQPLDSTAFDPGRTRMADVLRSWRARKAQFEREFFASRVPIA